MKNDYGPYGKGTTGYVHYRQAMDEAAHSKHSRPMPGADNPFAGKSAARVNQKLEEEAYERIRTMHVAHDGTDLSKIETGEGTHFPYGDEHRDLYYLNDEMNEHGYDSRRWVEFAWERDLYTHLQCNKSLTGKKFEAKMRRANIIDRVITLSLVVGGVLVIIWKFLVQ